MKPVQVYEADLHVDFDNNSAKIIVETNQGDFEIPTTFCNLYTNDTTVFQVESGEIDKVEITFTSVTGDTKTVTFNSEYSETKKEQVIEGIRKHLADYSEKQLVEIAEEMKTDTPLAFSILFDADLRLK